MRTDGRLAIGDGSAWRGPRLLRMGLPNGKRYAAREVNGGATLGLIKEHLECEHRGQVQAKDKVAIDMHFVRRLKPNGVPTGRDARPMDAF